MTNSFAQSPYENMLIRSIKDQIYKCTKIASLLKLLERAWELRFRPSWRYFLRFLRRSSKTCFQDPWRCHHIRSTYSWRSENIFLRLKKSKHFSIFYIQIILCESSSPDILGGIKQRRCCDFYSTLIFSVTFGDVFGKNQLQLNKIIKRTWKELRITWAKQKTAINRITNFAIIFYFHLFSSENKLIKRKLRNAMN